MNKKREIRPSNYQNNYMIFLTLEYYHINQLLSVAYDYRSKI